MKKLSITVLVFMLLVFSGFAQDNTNTPQRTPEQEAAKQTEKLQQELHLTPEQAKQIYEINLKYARERQISNKRSEAMERMKNKNAEIQQVLNTEQNNKLQSKRCERKSVEQTTNMPQPINPTTVRSTSEAHPVNTTNRAPIDRPVRSTFRPSGSGSETQSTSNPPQATRKTTTTEQNTSAPRTTNPAAARPKLPTQTYTPRKQESTPPPASNGTGNRK